MTWLRALIGAYSMAAFMGFVVFVPLGWTIVLGIAATSPEKIVQGQPEPAYLVFLFLKFISGERQNKDASGP